MANRNQHRNEPQTEVTNNASDAEFGVEYTQSKKRNKNVVKEANNK